MNKNVTIGLFIIWVWQAQLADAQEKIAMDSAQLYRIEMLDGNEFLGHVTGEEADHFVLQTITFGDLVIKRDQIKRITPVDTGQVVNGKIWFDNPQAARYFWAPNGYGLKEGEGYYQNIWVLFNQVSYGFTDNFSVGVGVLPVFLFGASENPVWITPKLSVPLIDNKLNLGVGTIFMTVTGVKNASAGLLYGTLTVGSRDQNASFGMAYGYTSEDMARIPLLNLSGMSRLGQRFYFVTENYAVIFDGQAGGFLSAGFRSITKRIAIDYGLFVPYASDMGTVVAIPWLGISVPFGR